MAADSIYYCAIKYIVIKNNKVKRIYNYIYSRVENHNLAYVWQFPEIICDGGTRNDQLVDMDDSDSESPQVSRLRQRDSLI